MKRLLILIVMLLLYSVGLTQDTLAGEIEKATGYLDVIETTQNPGVYDVYGVFFFPTFNTPEEAQAILKQTYEAVWKNIPTSSGLVVIHLLQSQKVMTLEYGPGTIAFLFQEASISVGDMNNYLAGDQALTDFVDLVKNHELSVMQAKEFIPYTGVPTDALKPDVSGEMS